MSATPTRCAAAPRGSSGDRGARYLALAICDSLALVPAYPVGIGFSLLLPRERLPELACAGSGAFF